MNNNTSNASSWGSPYPADSYNNFVCDDYTPPFTYFQLYPQQFNLLATYTAIYALNTVISFSLLLYTIRRRRELGLSSLYSSVLITASATSVVSWCAEIPVNILL